MLNAVEAVISNYYPGEDDPGCSVLLVRGDDTYTWSRGVASLETREPVTSQTNFRLASVTKQFTAACILQLRDAGRLHLDQPLTDFFPEFPQYGHDIQLNHLLRHTSGIKDYEKLLLNESAIPVMDAEVLQILSQQSECDFPPGSQFRYSNSGYALLAMVVESVSGLSYPDYLKDNIFQPLSMSTTIAYVNRPGSSEVPNRAIGYSLNDSGKFVWSDQNATTAVLGDGGIYCSAEDYACWIRGYRGGKVLKSETVMEALRPGQTSGGDVVPYGYGWRLELTGTGNTWRPYHPGSTSGFRNGVIMDPEGRWAVLVLSNRSNGDAVSLAGEIAKLVEETS